MNRFAPDVKKAMHAMLISMTLSATSAAAVAETNAAHVVPDDGVLFLSTTRDGQVIWDLSRVPDRENTNLEFPYLIRFQDRWFCSFREGDKHGNDPSGRARVITSTDGRDWETAALLEWEGGDIRDPRMSVTPDGQLMLNSSIYFIGEQKENPADWEVPGKRQSVTWLSKDGCAWTGPYACPTGFDTWRWDVAWHDGYGYSAGYAGKDRRGTLYRTRDGKSWEVWVENFFGGPGTEAALAFGADGAGYCLLRGGGFYGKFAVGQAPDYKQWTWQDMQIDASRDGTTESGAAFGQRTSSIVGGQKLLRLSDGRLVAATAKGGFDLFWVDPERSLFTRFVRISDGSSYPGLAEHDGEFWITNAQRVEGYSSVKSGIYLVRVKVPPPASLDRLLATVEEVLAAGAAGFGTLYRNRLNAVRADVVARQRQGGMAAGWSERLRLRKALADSRRARELRETVGDLVADASGLLADPAAGFGVRYQDGLRAAVAPLATVLGDQDATLSDVEDGVARLKETLRELKQAQAVQSRADHTLAATAALTTDSAAGFAQLYQARLRQQADHLRRALGESTATLATVRDNVERVLDAAHAYRRVDRDVPVRVEEITQLPASIVCATAADWSRGLRIDTSVTNDTLVPSRTPALLFGDGQRTSVQVGNPPAIAALGDAFTVSVRVYAQSTEEAYRTVLDKGGRDAAIAIRQARTLANRNVVSVRMYAEAEPAPHEPYQVSCRPPDAAAFDHRWRHYAATYDGEALRLYIDGALAGESPKKGRADLLEGDLVFGSLAGGGEPWLGYIADVAVWSDALSGARIAALARRGIQGNEKGLVGYWPLDEGEGETARDVTAGGLHGRIGGGTWRRIPVRRGVRISPPIRLGAGLNISTGTIEWEAEVGGDPDVAGVQVFYGTSTNEEALPAEWHEATNGVALASDALRPGLAGRCLWLKQVLTTDDPASVPGLRRLVLRVRE